MSIRWGVLSTARINGYFLAAAQRSSTTDVAAVASRDGSRAKDYANSNDIARAHGSYEELLEDAEIDAVYISLPNSLHVEWTLRALRAGKHVLVEKPLSRRAADVEEVFSVARASERWVMEAFMYRHNPQTERLVESIQSGLVGPPRLLRAAFSFTVGSSENIRLDPRLDGGSLMDVGCYCVHAARTLFGEPLSVFGEQSLSAPKGVDVVFAGTMRFGGEVVATFDSGLALPQRDELELIGEEGSLFLDDPWHCRTPGIELRRDGATEMIPVEAADSYLLQLENFNRAVEGRGEPLLGRDDAIGQARVIEALYLAAEERRLVSPS